MKKQVLTMAKLKCIIDWIENISFAVAMVACIVGILLVTSIDVIKRYFLGSALGWAYYVAVISLVWIVFLALARVTKEGHHIQFGLVYSRLRGRIRRTAQGLHYIAGLVMFGLIGWQAVDYTIIVLRDGIEYSPPDFTVSAAIAWIVIAFGCLLASLRLAINLVKDCFLQR